MLFSICMCTYNRYEYIKYTIDSILNQLVDKKYDYEFVICDSGSTDGTLEYLNSLANVRIINIGLINLARSYIHAFDKAQGEYIINMNDHMYIHMDNVLKCLNDLNSESEIECVMYSLSAYGIGVNNRRPFEFPVISGRVEGLLLHHLFIFRNQNVAQFDEKYNRNWWDFDYMIKILTHGKSIGLYRYVFGCEFKIDDNYEGLLWEQRNNNANNNDDTKYFKEKNALFIDLIYKNQNSTLFLIINRVLLRFINFYLIRLPALGSLPSILKKESKYTINKIPLREGMSDSLKRLRIDKYNKTVSVILFNIIIKMLYNSIDEEVIDKNKTKNFYSIQRLSKDTLKKFKKQT